MTTTWAGAAHQGIDIINEPARIMSGLPYALALMLILGAHELGHYFTACFHGIRTTWPFFIPVPFALGTFSACIQIKSPVENRKALFDVGVAGPLAGLISAIPALLIGLHFSTVIPGSESATILHNGVKADSSFLFALRSKSMLGDLLSEGHRIICIHMPLQSLSAFCLNQLK